MSIRIAMVFGLGLEERHGCDKVLGMEDVFAVFGLGIAQQMVVDPLRLFDCCLISDGAVVVLIARGDRIC